MFSSIRERLWLSYAALIVVALSIMAAVITLFLLRNPYLYRQTSVRLRAAESLLSRAPRVAARGDVIAEALDVRVLTLSADGELLHDSGGDRAPLRVPLFDRRPRNIATARDTAGTAWLYSLTRLPDGTWMMVAAVHPGLLPALGLLRDELWRPLLQGGVIGLLLALVLAYLLARWIADPLGQLVAAARGVSAGNRRAAAGGIHQLRPLAGEPAALLVEERGPKEVRELTEAFRAMLERVATSQQSQREFVANVSHELKTPLTSIQGFSQAILDGTASDPEAQRQAAQIIHDEAGRMQRMVVGLLDLARLDAGTADLNMVPVDTSSLLDAVVERLRPIAADSGVQLDMSSTIRGLSVLGDGDRLAQLFSNLIENALKFTPRGGSVSVRIEPDENGIRVVIADTGAGIPAADLPHIFDRFYQVDTSRGGGAGHGAGLGLAISREIAEAHGGRITVRSVLGQGAEFVVHLPPLEGSRVGRGTT